MPLTCFKRSIVRAQTERALPSTFRDLDTESILGIGFKVINVLVEFGAVDELVFRGVCARAVADRVETVVRHALTATCKRGV